MAKVQTNKQTNLRSLAGRTRPWITGICVCSNSIELSLLHRLIESCAGLTAASLMFAGAVLQPTSPSTGRPPAVTGGQGAR